MLEFSDQKITESRRLRVAKSIIKFQVCVLAKGNSRNCINVLLALAAKKTVHSIQSFMIN